MAGSEVATGTTATPAGRSSDVIVVGAGPVGLVTALLLDRRGWQVTVLERWPEPYLLPRAAHFDDEVARLLADARRRSAPAPQLCWLTPLREHLRIQ